MALSFTRFSSYAGTSTRLLTFSSAAALTIAENATIIDTATLTGSPVVTWSLDGGPDAALFAINSSSGALAFGSSKNYEVPVDDDNDGVYEVIIKAVNSDGVYAKQLTRVTVTDVNEAPTITSSATFSVVTGTTAVGTMTSTDPDVGATKTWSISAGDDQALFSINSSTGALRFIDAPDVLNPADANTDNAYLVTVRVTDGTNAVTKALTVTVVAS